ncbi:dephospho-CoA kinase [Nakamurella silvestris]|nr:dephospho-CoA kinase [Nakamurella silvestris]
MRCDVPPTTGTPTGAGGRGPLLVAVTGGIGSGKSTVSAILRELGAVVVDSDVLARAVVEPGTPGLAAVVDRFGSGVLHADGSLDRPAVGRIVFADDAARRDLERIIHPLVRTAADNVAAAAPAGSVVVNDIPLLVDLGQTAQFHLVIGVGVEFTERLRRLVGRGMAEADARSRIAAQITDLQRRPLTDLWLSNDGSPDELAGCVRRSWADRVEPMAAGLVAGRPATAAVDGLAPAVFEPSVLSRVQARVRAALSGLPALRVAVDGNGITVSGVGGAGDRLVPALGRAGFFPAGPGVLRSCDPAQPVAVSALG